MGYDKKVHRVLGGSLNLRGAPTEIPDHDFQKCVNAAYDQDNVIRSRKGHSLICTASGIVKQMIKAMEGLRWQAVGESYIVGFKQYVWKAGAGKASKACTDIITTAGMRKSKGTQDWRWIPAAPTEAPTISTAEDVVTLVDDFAGGWLLETGQDDEDEEEVDPGDFGENGMLVRGTAGAVKSFTKDVSLDLYDGYDKDDVFKIKVRAKKWSNIAGVSFDVDVGDGSFTNDYYKCRMPIKEIKAGRKETVTFYIRKRKLEVDVGAADKFKYGEFERIGQTTDKDWRSVNKLRVKVEFSGTTKFWFTRWDMVGNEDNTLEGDDYGVCYTYTTEDGHESNPSPKSKLITVNRGSINVTDMVISSDPQVTGQNVYLTGGTLGAVYQCNGAKEAADGEEDPGPVTGADYTIIASADDLTDFNKQLENDHDDPPDADGIAGPYYGRILAFKGSRFYWTKQNKPFAFKHPDEADGDWADIDENAGNIKHISIRPHEAWIYAENEIFILVGDPADAAGEVHPSGIAQGAPSRTGVAKAGSYDIAYLGMGIYAVDGNSAKKLSQQIDPIFKNRAVTLSDGTTAQPISDPATVAVGYDDGIVRVAYDNTRGLVCELATGRWFQDSRSFSSFQGESEAGILGGTSTGQVLKLEDGYTDAGSGIEVDFLSKLYDYGIHDNEKIVEDVTIYHDLNGQSLTATVYTTAGAAYSRPLSGLRTVMQLNNADGVRTRNTAVRIQGTTTNEVLIRGIDFNYYTIPREAKSYDTGIQDGGTHRVKLIRELLPTLENDNSVEFRLETDVPSFALTQRASHAVTTNTSRRAEPIVMAAEYYGHNFRVIGSGSGYFHLEKLYALLQVVGTFLHGSKGEYYLSDPLDFSTERVKLIKEIEIVYSTLGTVALTLSTDLPGNAIVARGVATLLATVGEQSVKVPLVSTIKARLIQLRLAPTADCRIEAIRLFIKLIGNPGATSWQWVELPLEKTQDAIWQALPFSQDAVA
jgi:hypothetical protein